MTGIINKIQAGGTVTATGHSTLATLTNDDIGALSQRCHPRFMPTPPSPCTRGCGV